MTTEVLRPQHPRDILGDIILHSSPAVLAKRIYSYDPRENAARFVAQTPVATPEDTKAAARITFFTLERPIHGGRCLVPAIGGAAVFTRVRRYDEGTSLAFALLSLHDKSDEPAHTYNLPSVPIPCELEDGNYAVMQPESIRSAIARFAFDVTEGRTLPAMYRLTDSVEYYQLRTDDLHAMPITLSL